MTCFIPNVCKLRVENCGFSLFSEFLITLVHYLAKYLVQMFIELEYPEIVFLRAASWLLVLKMWISFFLSYFNQICELNHRCKMAIVSHEFDIKFTWMKKKNNTCMIFKWENVIWFQKFMWISVASIWSCDKLYLAGTKNWQWS